MSFAADVVGFSTHAREVKLLVRPIGSDTTAVWLRPSFGIFPLNGLRLHHTSVLHADVWPCICQVAGVHRRSIELSPISEASGSWKRTDVQAVTSGVVTSNDSIARDPSGLSNPSSLRLALNCPPTGFRQQSRRHQIVLKITDQYRWINFAHKALHARGEKAS